MLLNYIKNFPQDLTIYIFSIFLDYEDLEKLFTLNIDSRQLNFLIKIFKNSNFVSPYKFRILSNFPKVRMSNIHILHKNIDNLINKKYLSSVSNINIYFSCSSEIENEIKIENENENEKRKGKGKGKGKDYKLIKLLDNMVNIKSLTIIFTKPYYNLKILSESIKKHSATLEAIYINLKNSYDYRILFNYLYELKYPKLIEIDKHILRYINKDNIKNFNCNSFSNLYVENINYSEVNIIIPYFKNVKNVLFSRNDLSIEGSNIFLENVINLIKINCKYIINIKFFLSKISNENFLKIIKYFPDLEYLQINFNRYISDSSLLYIMNLKKLKRLYITSQTPIESTKNILMEHFKGIDIRIKN